MYGKGGWRVSKAELRPPEVDPYFERKKIALGGVTKSPAVTILTLEQNPPERKFLTYVKVAEDLKNLCFISVKINISTMGGFRVGFFQPDTNHP